MFFRTDYRLWNTGTYVVVSVLHNQVLSYVQIRPNNRWKISNDSLTDRISHRPSLGCR